MSGGTPETPVLSAVEIMKIKFNHEGHEAHEDAQAFKSGDRRSPFVNFVLFRTGCSGG